MKASRLLLAAFMASLLVEGIARPQVIHGDILFRDQPVLDETERLKLFYERHGAYPDPKWLEHENPNYSRVMEERTKEVMKIKDREKRFHEWQFLCQARMVPTFTENQWGIEFVPKEMHDKLYKKFHEMLPSAGDEGLGLAVNGRESGAKFFPQEDLNYEVIAEMGHLIPPGSLPVHPPCVHQL